MNRCTVSSSMRCSSVKVKFMVALKLQDHLRDNIFLDFIRATVNRELTHIKVIAGDTRRITWPGRTRLLTHFHDFVDEGARRRPGGLYQQFRDCLLDLGALNFYDP